MEIKITRIFSLRQWWSRLITQALQVVQWWTFCGLGRLQYWQLKDSSLSLSAHLYNISYGVKHFFKWGNSIFRIFCSSRRGKHGCKVIEKDIYDKNGINDCGELEKWEESKLWLLWRLNNVLVLNNNPLHYFWKRVWWNLQAQRRKRIKQHHRFLGRSWKPRLGILCRNFSSPFFPYILFKFYFKNEFTFTPSYDFLPGFWYV